LKPHLFKNQNIKAGQPMRLLDSRARLILNEAFCYWEAKRIVYNAILAAVVGTWLVFTWPHFRAAATLESARLVRLVLVLAALANLCYSAAYLADIPLQFSGLECGWRRWRWSVFLAGTLFAALLANYWIADEVYPYVR
jgi:hypothetical protein